MIQRARANAHQNLIRFDGRLRRVFVYQNVRSSVLMNPSKLHIEVHCRPSSAAGCYHFVQMRKVLLPLAATLVLLQAQTGARFALTVDNIMRGPGLVGYEPAQVRWSGDSRQIYFQWKQPAQKEDEPMDTYVVNRDGSGLRKLSVDETQRRAAAIRRYLEGPSRRRLRPRRRYLRLRQQQPARPARSPRPPTPSPIRASSPAASGSPSPARTTSTSCRSRTAPSRR